MKRSIILSMVMFSLTSCNGIFYPKIFFDITPTEKTPCFSPDLRFKNAEKYSQEIALSFSQPGNSFKKKFKASIFVKKQYKNLKINKISYESIYGNGIFLQNADFKLPEKIVPYSESPEVYDCYYKKNGFYWCRFLIPVDKLSTLPLVDFQEVFKNQKPGNRFVMTITIEYSFDDEENRTTELYYEVYVNKNSFTSPFLGM